MIAIPPRPRSHGSFRTVAAALTAAGALLGVSACASPAPVAGGSSTSAGPRTAPRESPATAPPATPQSGLAKGLALPMAAYMENYSQRQTINAALGRLTHDCMARFGFSYDPPPSDGNPASIYDDTNMARRYGITDQALAAKLGYGLGDDSYTPPPGPTMTDAEIAVFSGHVALRPGAAPAPPGYNGIPIPKDGCRRESLDKVGGMLDTTLPGHLDAQSMDTSQADPAVQSALREWSSCMAGRGYTVALPSDANTLAPAGGSQGPGSAEITVALADIDCKRKVDLVGIWFRTESQVQNRLIEQNQLALGDVRDRIAAAVRTATAVTG